MHCTEFNSVHCLSLGCQALCHTGGFWAETTMYCAQIQLKHKETKRPFLNFKWEGQTVAFWVGDFYKQTWILALGL